MKAQETQNNIRRAARLSWQVVRLLSLFTQVTGAQDSDAHDHEIGGSAQSSEVLSAAQLNQAVALAANYLVRVCGPDGRFAYRVNISSGEQSRTYNIVRHAGAIYALAMMQYSKPDRRAVDAMVRASSFLRQNYMGPGVRPDQLVVWSKPLSQPSAAELGATGLGLVALTAVNDVKPNSVPLEQLQALGRFLLFLQKDDGSFVSKFNRESGPDEDFNSLYYPGEAALGLIDLYEADHNPLWLNSAAKALSFLAKSRAKLPDVPPDHWVLIATAKFLPYYAQSASPASRDALIQHAIHICQALMKGQLRNPDNQALDGAFDSKGRTAPTATRVEGLLAALEFLPDEGLRIQIKDTVDHGIAFLFRAQIHDGVYAGGMPGAYVSSTPGASSVRIDFVQHALCAWLRYQQLAHATRTMR
jgi:hypothetical protein